MTELELRLILADLRYDRLRYGRQLSAWQWRERAKALAGEVEVERLQVALRTIRAESVPMGMD